MKEVIDVKKTENIRLLDNQVAENVKLGWRIYRQIRQELLQEELGASPILSPIWAIRKLL